LTRFFVTGVGANVVNYATYVLGFRLGATVFMASIVGYALGLVVSYQLGKSWIFKTAHKTNAKTMLLFLAVYSLGGLGMSWIIEFLCIDLLLDYRLSWFLGAAFASLNNFLGAKLLVFQRM
jgi:putative flippase GtrA